MSDDTGNDGGGFEPPSENENNVPDMIARDQPKPRLKPPVPGQTIENEHFDQQWEEQNEKYRLQNEEALRQHEEAQRQEQAQSLQEEANEAVPVTETGITEEFNQRSDEIGRADEQQFAIYDELVEAQDQLTELHDNGQEVPAELRANINSLNHNLEESQSQLIEMQDTGQQLDPPLELGDDFDRAMNQGPSAELGQEIE